MKQTKVLVLSAVALLTLSGCGAKDKPFAGNAAELGYTVSELENLVLGEYDALYQLAAKITDPTKTDERYKAFAKAEYNLIFESGLMVPWLAQNGTTASVSKTVPWQAGRASYGLTSDKFKNVVATPNAITKEQRAAVTAEYELGKAKDVSHSAGADGWISLANENANGEIGADGKYVAGGISFDTKKELKTTYTKEPQNSFLNYLTNTWTYNSYHYCNMVDGLVENDKYGNIVGAVADKYKVENLEGGKQKWTFHIRDGVKWVKNSDGSYVADVVADDFVAAAEYVLDPENAAGASNLITGFVDGAAAYLNEADASKRDFSKVGISASADGKEISYTLIEETPYFITALTYSPYLPVNRAFLASQGSDFGKDENKLLVNGAFRITKHESESQMVYTKNADYYDAAHVYLDTVTRQFIAGTKTSADVRGMYENGEIDSFSVNAKDEEGWKKYVTGPDGTGTQKDPYDGACNAITSFGSATYFGYFNFNRTTWEVNDKANKKNYDAKMATAKAILNKDFRLGFLYGLDVIQTLKMYSPSYPYDWLMRGYTNRELVSFGGKDYADYVDDVFNEKQGTTGQSLTGILNNGKDAVLNPDKAKALFASAKAALMEGENGLTEKDFPIRIDVIGDMDVESLAFQQAMYKTIEENSDGVVKIQINIPTTDEQDTEWGSEIGNYDFSMWSGWGPDYADPNTFLHTLCIGGDMVEYLGFVE